MSKTTENALIARGVPSHLAEKIALSGYTVSSLKLKTEEDLRSLGLTQDQVTSLLREQRPPIPADVVVKIISESAATCSICKTAGKSFIIHHISQWSVSKSHHEDNLILLCLDCHDRVHSQHDLSHNYSEAEIKEFKRLWQEKVLAKEARAIQGIVENSSSLLDYINLTRLIELAGSLGTSMETIYSEFLREAKFLSKEGFILPERDWDLDESKRDYFYDFGQGKYLYYHFKEIFERVIGSQPTGILTRRGRKDFCSEI